MLAGPGSVQRCRSRSPGGRSIPQTAGQDGTRSVYPARIVRVSSTTQPGRTTDADTVAVGVFEGEDPPADTPAEVAELLSSGEARRSLRSLGLTHAQGKRWLIVGLGERGELTGERARVAAAAVHARALEIGARAVCVQLPSLLGAEIAAALVEGTVLADYRFDRCKSAPGEAGAGSAQAALGARGGGEAPVKHLERLIVSAPDGAAGESGEAGLERRVTQAALVAEATNSARDLQNRPANDLTPTALAEYAVGLAGEIDALSVEVEGRAGIQARRMGAFAAVAQGSEQEPALITLRYDPPGGAGVGAGANGPVLGFVGKAVTFDSGGISLKPGAKMAEMKFDMSGGAAVIEAVAAIARMGLPVRLVAVVGATENLPSGRSVKPGDIVRAIERDDDRGQQHRRRGTARAGRLPVPRGGAGGRTDRRPGDADRRGDHRARLHIRGADEQRRRARRAGRGRGRAGGRDRVATAAARGVRRADQRDLRRISTTRPKRARRARSWARRFCRTSSGDTPWAHLDIAGSAWDLGRAYVGKGASGYGVRLLVELARSYCV